MSLNNIKAILPASIAVTAAYSTSLFGLYVQPQLLIPLMEKFQATDPEIGQLFMVENLFYFIFLVVATVPITKYSRTKIAYVGTIFLVLGNLGSAYANTIDSLMLLRAFVAIGSGIVSGAATASASSSSEPERTFALSGVMYLCIFSISHALLPYIVEWMDIKGVYLSLALYSLLIIPAYMYLLPPILKNIGNSDFITEIKNAPYKALAIIAMFGLLIYELGQNGVFTYMDKLGANTGIESEERGLALFLSSLFGISGGILATWLGTKYGRFKPLLIGVILNIGIGALFTI
ncbi:MAG: MFS transporter, partial [Flavobacteriales bacterium]|nr:MFS transporter [Flavobacteriales bacterium]